MKKKHEVLIHSTIQLDVSDKLYNKLISFDKGVDSPNHRDELASWIANNTFRTNNRSVWGCRLEYWKIKEEA